MRTYYYNLLGNAIVEIFKIIILPVLLIILFIVIVNTIVQYVKYGKKAFDVFKPKNIKNYKDKILFNTLNEATWKKKVIKLKYLKSNYIMIDSNGISLFKLLDIKGIIKGDINDLSFICKDKNKLTRINNPFIELENDEKIIKEKINISLTKYLVIIQDCNIKVATDIKILEYNSVLYHLPKGNNDVDIETIIKKLNV